MIRSPYTTEIERGGYSAIIYKDGDLYVAEDDVGAVIGEGTNATTVIHAARDKIATLGGAILFKEATYELTTPIEWNVAGLNVNTVGCAAPFWSTTKGVIFKAVTGWSGTYLMKVSANDQMLDNIYLNCNSLVNIGMQIEDCKSCVFPNLTIVEPKQKGLYIYANAALTASHRFGRLGITMYTTAEVDARGIVLKGNGSPAFATVNHFDQVHIGIKGVTTSYGVDFVKFSDGNRFNYLQITYATAPLTAGVIYNSDTPGSDMDVYSNVFFEYLYEAGNDIQVIANKAKVRFPNIITNVLYPLGACRGHQDDLRINSWGVRPFVWKTLFESLDGFWNNSSGTGSAVLGSTKLTLATGATTGGIGQLIKNPNYVPTLSFTRRRKFKTTIQVSTTTNQTAYIVIGLVGNHLLGFKIINNTIYGVTSDGTESTVSLQTVVAATNYELECHFTPNVDARFYVNGIDKGSITTHLPTSATELYIANTYIVNAADVNKEMTLSYWQFEQEGF